MTKHTPLRDNHFTAPVAPARVPHDAPWFQLLEEDAEAMLRVRLRARTERSPLQLLSKAAAAGFLLGMVIPVRTQTLVLASVVRAGVRMVLQSHGPQPDDALDPTSRPVAGTSPTAFVFGKTNAPQATRRAALWEWM